MILRRRRSEKTTGSTVPASGYAARVRAMWMLTVRLHGYLIGCYPLTVPECALTRVCGCHVINDVPRFGLSAFGSFVHVFDTWRVHFLNLI